MNADRPAPRRILPAIVLSQLPGTSLWFAINAVMPDLQRDRLLLWGVTVVGDSPQFSTLTALNAPRDAVGSVLTFVNCIGFAISIVSIELFAHAAQQWPLAMLLPWLAIGPALGLRALRPLLRQPHG
jgi:hypothetical protein